MNLRQHPIGRATAVALGLALLLLAPLPLLPDSSVQTSTTIARPPETIFAYVTTPANWPHWHPSSLRVDGQVARSGQVGDQVDEDFRVAGIKGHAVWRVTERIAPWRWSISGVTGHGGRGTVTYRLRPVAGGAEFVREFRYGRPNLLFVLLDAVWLNRRIFAESEAATRNLKRSLEALAPSLVVAAPRTISAQLKP
ncbi:SRPBCC family protein [Sphingobium fluviale]|uniref:SRPBCC family protein n=1 Tax=Sphingobium fluviale TaxID=2506423 RepID=A0A4Q1KPG5_9SPHN|nr:SRPBCC family protein [Sphingobium fluviale]RXR30784.1 SRPBCC family protein [Sphingobium fluviale]